MLHLGIAEDSIIQLNYYVELLHMELMQKPHDIKTYSNLQMLEDDLQKGEKLEILILDIRFPHGNGIDAAKRINRMYPNISIIFISAYLEQAPLVYDTEHVYFIYKKDMEYRLPLALDEAIKKIQLEKNNFLKLTWKNTRMVIPQKNIIYIERIKRKTKINAYEQEYLTYTKLEDIMKGLNDDFLRVHNSFIIHTNCLREIHRTYMIMKNNAYIPVSRTYEKDVRHLIETMFTQ